MSAKEHFPNASGFFTTYSIAKDSDSVDNFQSEIEDAGDNLAPVKKNAAPKVNGLISIADELKDSTSGFKTKA